MAGKHYIIATQTGYLVDTVTGYPYEFHSKEAAVKALAAEVKAAAQECRRSHKTCSVVGSARKGSVQIRVGGRQGYHLWQRYVINERPGARKPPRGARTTEAVHHATKKSAAQLDREIAEATEFQRRRNLPGVEVRRMFGTRYTEIHLSRGGTDLGSRTDMLKRGKVVSTLYVLPPIADR